MKVLFYMRPGFNRSVAGDSVQILNTRKHLLKLGVKVDISFNSREDLSKYNVVHMFNIMRIPETYQFYNNALRQNKKILTTPIFVDMGQYYRKIGGLRLAQWKSANALRKKILDGSHYLLPNSHLEMDWIKQTFCTKTPWEIINNGVDNTWEQVQEGIFTKIYGVKDYILYVGRLSPIKNQLALIAAAKDLDLPIVLIGPVNHADYGKKCLQMGDNKVKYIPGLEHSQLAAAYKDAKVHVQPSWFETTGLASLEAAAMGTPVVITDRGATKEYFKDMVEYCQPQDVNSIRNAISRACQTFNTERLQEYVLTHYTWEKVAQKTLDIYIKVLQ
jgi:glycosyltransferase involved in cell wall biosynthesis